MFCPARGAAITVVSNLIGNCKEFACNDSVIRLVACFYVKHDLFRSSLIVQAFFTSPLAIAGVMPIEL